MNNNHLKRLLNLVRKTGDRLVVADKETDDIFVIMDLDEYESLISLDKDSGEAEYGFEQEFLEPSGLEEIDEEMVEQINENIADWHKEEAAGIENGVAANSTGDLSSDNSNEKDREVDSKKPNLTSGKSSMPSVKDVLSEDKYVYRQFNDKPRETFLEEEDLSDVAEEEEEKFYLEPVE